MSNHGRPTNFGSMSPEARRAIASIGGKAAYAQGKQHKFTREEAQAAGRKAGALAASKPGRMAAIGRLGGIACSKDVERMREMGRKGAAARNAKRAAMATEKSAS